MVRSGPRFALVLLLGFVLGGVVAPAWHAAQHGLDHVAAEHPGSGNADHLDGTIALEGDSPGHLHDCALCALHFTSTETAPTIVLVALHTTGDIGPAALSPPHAPTAAPYAPRGPPAG